MNLIQLLFGEKMCSSCGKQIATKRGLCPYCYYQNVTVANETLNDKQKRVNKGQKVVINGDKLKL